jgi:hypothetical protein
MARTGFRRSAARPRLSLTCTIKVAGDDSREDVQRLLTPVGIGPQARHRFAMYALTSVVFHQQPMSAFVVRPTSRRSPVSGWRYGYYLGACAASLPDEARSDLADMG